MVGYVLAGDAQRLGPWAADTHSAARLIDDHPQARVGPECAVRSRLSHHMPTKKQPNTSEPSWQAILEEIRSQNRALIEAVEAMRIAVEQRFERLERNTDTRFHMVDIALRELRLDVRQLQGDVRGVEARVEALAHLDERVSALEKRLTS